MITSGNKKTSKGIARKTDFDGYPLFANPFSIYAFYILVQEFSISRDSILVLLKTKWNLVLVKWNLRNFGASYICYRLQMYSNNWRANLFTDDLPQNIGAPMLSMMISPVIIVVVPKLYVKLSNIPMLICKNMLGRSYSSSKPFPKHNLRFEIRGYGRVYCNIYIQRVVHLGQK